jgi:hypothetical protein
MAYRLWLGRDTVIFVIRFTFHVSRVTILLVGGTSSRPSVIGLTRENSLARIHA